MIDEHSNAPQTPPRLSSRQSAIFNLLRGIDTTEYPLSHWYLGALYAIENTHNPDRFSQAAQSIRELLEKLPRALGNVDVQANLPNFKQLRMNLHERFEVDKNAYENSWEGKAIDSHLGKTLTKINDYLEANQQPTRREQAQKAVESMDPLSNRLDAKIRERKRDKFHWLWGEFERILHHQLLPNEEEFSQHMEKFEDIVLDLLAPVTAQDQLEIQSILNRQYRSRHDTKRLFSLVKRTGANYMLFVNQVSDLSWLDDMNRRSYFSNPPGIEKLPGGRVNFPYWVPIDYLIRVADQDTKSVVDIVLKMGNVNNPLILNGIVKIALKATSIEQSLRLKKYAIEYMDSPYMIDQSNTIPKLIERWFGESNDATNAALELMKKVVSFHPDPETEEKVSRREKNPDDWAAILNPAPKFKSWEYQKIIEKTIRPLAEREPFEIACILIDAVATMITFRQYADNPTYSEDNSEYWCRRLDRPSSDYLRCEQDLVHTLTLACQKVFEKLPESITELNTILSRQQWKVFKRLRQHLYALHLNEETKPWIRKFVLIHPNYAKWSYRYEFQRMLRRACEQFGEELLTKEERVEIFDSILSGPSEDTDRIHPGDKFTKNISPKQRRLFHRMQLNPFSTVLFGKYSAYLKKLETETKDPITDEDYSPFGEIKSIAVSHRSPKSHGALANLEDEDLLAYINEWQSRHGPTRDWMDEVNIHALSGAFQKMFMGTVIPDENRLNFWLKNRDRIERPIYVQVMVGAMQKDVEKGEFQHIDRWLEFCQWVLSHSDTNTTKEGIHDGEKSRETPNWATSRRTVGEFIETCLGEKIRG